MPEYVGYGKAKVVKKKGSKAPSMPKPAKKKKKMK